MGKKLSFIKNIISNKFKLAEFALTNICTAKCDFCSIWQQKEKHMVDKESALATIRHLSKMGIGFITLTGGEPLLHPNFGDIIKECTRLNMISSILNADARLLNEKRLNALAEAKVDLMCISVDSHLDEVASKSRKIPDLLSHIEKAVHELHARKIKVMASTLICNYNKEALFELFNKCTEIGFDMISVNYPEFSESPVYTLGGDAIKISREELIKAMEEVISLKPKFKLVNTVTSIRNIIKYLNNETPDFMCLGGYRAIFVDWFLNAYPCMYLGRNLGPVLELTEDKFEKVLCNACNMSWYRDFSIYFQGLKSLKPLLEGVNFTLNFLKQ
ncbi:MAG: radical SAM protein [Spirochaetales bacterium]|nr:radical SAM protein [Spirochaetales bacterium]